MGNTARTRKKTRALGWFQPQQPLRRWQKLLVLSFVVAVIGAVVVLAVRNIRRQDAMAEWRKAIFANRDGLAWPVWDPGWPELRQPRRSVERVGDLHGPYAYAAKHQEVLGQIPCYCGCAREGHRSNLDCYVERRSPGGQLIWTDHTFSCPMCANITREVAILLEAGKTVQDARAEIEAQYSKYYGAGTPTTQLH